MPKRHRRRWIALFATFALLFQQLAMAAYVCAKEATQAEAESMPACDTADGADRSRCHEHCHPTSAIADHASALTVPPCVVPASGPIVGASPRPRPASERTMLHPWATAPPLNVRYCSLQI